MKRLFILTIIIASIVSCQDKVTKGDDIFWENIYMNLDGNQELTLFNQHDSVVFKKWTDSLVTQNDSEADWMSEKSDWVRTNEQILSFKITRIEKDSLLMWTNSLLEPVVPVMRCTDYVGHLTVRIHYGYYDSRTTKTCEYSSICDWHIVSPDTKSIYNFLKRKGVDIE
jgi:hypothetical protein